MIRFQSMSLMCIGFNVGSNILTFLMNETGLANGGLFEMTTILLLSNIVLSVMVAFGGALLGIGAMILKEKPALKSVVATLANIVYIIGYFSFWKMV
ncbi:hypothetical protein [Priestia koreensis]|uniref:hypothetical protein n=1 Tax=Priestia koreensis TaxID=284581 RepID=UPI0034581A4F